MTATKIEKMYLLIWCIFGLVIVDKISDDAQQPNSSLSFTVRHGGTKNHFTGIFLILWGWEY